MIAATKWFVPFCLALLASAPAYAIFNPGLVSADAQWVAFVDMNGLRASVLGRQLVALMQRKMPQPSPSVGLELDMERMLATIGNVTAYGPSFGAGHGPVDGALVIEGTGDMRKIAEAYLLQATLTSNGEVQESSELPFPSYIIHKELFIGFPIESIILAGKSKEQVTKAYAVYRSAAPSLGQAANSPLARLLANSDRAYALAASAASPFAGTSPAAPQARLFQLVESGMISLSEQNQQTLVRAELLAKSNDQAEKLLKIVQGLAAMVSLTETSDRQLGEFLKAATVTRQDNTVSVRVAYSSDRIVQMIENAQQPAPAPAQRRAPPRINPKTFGNVLGEWKLDGAPPGSGPSAETLAVHTFPGVELKTGSVVTISAQLAGGFALLDRVDIFPMANSGPGLRFEAENMRVPGNPVPIFNAPYASNSRMVRLSNPRAFAQFEFPGAPGEYIVHVHYIDESAGTTTLAVSVRDPAPLPGNN